jgi:hypothetical protein
MTIHWNHLQSIIQAKPDIEQILNDSQERFEYVSDLSIDGNPMEYVSLKDDLVLIRHDKGLFMDNYSLKTMELIKHWKKDFYPDK